MRSNPEDNRSTLRQRITQSLDDAIAQAEVDGYISAEESERSVDALLRRFAKLAREGKIKPWHEGSALKIPRRVALSSSLLLHG